MMIRPSLVTVASRRRIDIRHIRVARLVAPFSRMASADSSTGGGLTTLVSCESAANRQRDGEQWAVHRGSVCRASCRTSRGGRPAR